MTKREKNELMAVIYARLRVKYPAMKQVEAESTAALVLRVVRRLAHVSQIGDQRRTKPSREAIDAVVAQWVKQARKVL